MEDHLAPCRIDEQGDGTFSLSFDDFDPMAESFEELGQEGGGFGWHGVVEALVRMKAPHLAGRLEYDPEASMFVSLSPERRALEEVAGLIRDAIGDPALLREAIENADPELMG